MTQDSSLNYNVGIIGLGPVGAVSGICFAKQGLRVVGVDRDPMRVKTLREGKSPFVEPGLDELVKEVTQSGHFTATTDLREVVINAPVIMIAVGTPTPRNAPDLSQLDTVCLQIAALLKEKNTPTVIAIRSTIPPGTIRNRLVPLMEKASRTHSGLDFHMVSNPEFLREGTAINDFFKTSRLIVGADTDYAAQQVEKLYEGIEAGERLRVNIESAEFAKYVDNTWHALKVSFANEIGRICQAYGGNVGETTRIFLSDDHLNISSAYLKPGFAFGGSCLPKDVRGLSHLADTLGVSAPIIEAILPSNQDHIALGIEAILAHKPKQVGLFGVAFKEHVDDLRESPALAIAAELIKCGIVVHAYDPAYAAGETLLLPQSEQPLHMKEIETLVNASDTLVLMHRLPLSESLAAQCRQIGKPVVDLTTLPKAANLFGKPDLQVSDVYHLGAG